MKLLCGKSLIGWTIETALAAQHVDKVIVSTDDTGIADISSRFGVEVIMRPSELSGPLASSESALLHVLQTLRETENFQPEVTVFLQCTSPLTLPEDIDGTVQALLDENADSAFAVTPFHYFLWRRKETGGVVGINHDKRSRLMRQEREPDYLETGAVYAMRTEGFQKAKHRFFGKTVMYIMPAERCLEIDELADLRIAEVLLRERQEHRKLALLPDTIGAVVLDFDGVFTDNRVIVFQDGQEAVICNRSDGWGLAQLKQLGVSIMVISREENPVVGMRCKKLGIPCMQGVRDKLDALRAWAQDERIDLSQVVYLGNDVNDLRCLKGVGCGVTVNDAHPQAQAAAQIVLTSKGGYGAIRELVSLIEQKRKED
jgi:N-acylneuraminate cytidylyltransferase